MKSMILTAITVSTILTGVCAQASPAYSFQQSVPSAGEFGNSSSLDGATFVRVSRLSGYFVISPRSTAIDTLGLADSPYRDSDNISRNGVGADAIAFRFGPDGKLEGYPMYISQTDPESFYTSRLAALTTDRTTLADVRAMFESHSIHVEKRGSRTVAYLEIPVYNPSNSGS